MAEAPQSIWDLWFAIADAYNGPGLQDEELAGIVGNLAHSFGFHLAPNELPASDYSLQTARDRAGAQAFPGFASALDVDFGPAGMVTVTNRLIASAKDPNDHRLDCLYEFCGTTNGSTPHPYTVDTNTDDPNNTQGWDDSHVTHVHLSIHRDVSNNFAALVGVAAVIAGHPLNVPQSGGATPIEDEDDDMTPEQAKQAFIEVLGSDYGKNIIIGACNASIKQSTPGLVAAVWSQLTKRDTFGPVSFAALVADTRIITARAEQVVNRIASKLGA